MPRPNLRDNILTAAIDRLTAKGYDATSVQDITDAAGAPKGSFYNHFPSKEHLAVEALHFYMTDRCSESFYDQTIPPLTRLRAHFEWLLSDTVAKHFRHGCMVGGLAASVDENHPMVRQAVCTAYADVTNLIAALLDEGKARCELPANRDTDELARAILDAWEGALLRARVEGQRRSLDAFMSVIFDHLIPGLNR